MPSEPVPPFEPDDSAGFRYEQFALYMEDRIRAGLYPPGARLPNARDLGAEHGIAEHTVRHAEMLLSDWGLIRVLAAKGCYIRPKEEWRRRSRRRKLGNAAGHGGRRWLWVESDSAILSIAVPLGGDTPERDLTHTGTQRRRCRLL